MSTYTSTTRSPGGDRPAAAAPRETRTRLRRWLSLGLAAVASVWSAIELGSLGLNHTIGPELYGVLVAALSLATGLLSGYLLWSGERRTWLTLGTLALWAIVALGGIAGAIAHLVGPVAGHGPVDLRERPIAAPLVFTALGLIGAAALFYGQRVGAWFGSWNGGR